MFKRTITYTDYNGNERTEDFYFNLSKAEATVMSLSVNGGYEQMIKDIIAAQDGAEIIKIFKELILKAYGEKSLDGKYFDKSDEISKRFASTEAYSQLFMELATDAKAATAFVNGIMPADVKKQQLQQTTNDTSGLIAVK
jgi:glucose-6-phosphate dehydrogenase assembly protein OpcA